MNEVKKKTKYDENLGINEKEVKDIKSYENVLQLQKSFSLVDLFK